MIGNKIDEKVKQDVLRAYRDGGPGKKIAERFCISLTSVVRIVRKKVAEHSHENNTKSKEISAIKNLMIWVAVLNSVKQEDNDRRQGNKVTFHISSRRKGHTSPPLRI